MDRREAILRELNVYPLWKRREQSVPGKAQEPVAGHLTEPIAPTILEAVPQDEAVVFRKPGLRKSGLGKPALGKSGQSEPELGNLNWSELKQQVTGCTACQLRAGCTQTVFGVGDEKADWLFVGEGPGADEDVQGEPFVGQAGKLLDSMLAAIKLKRGKNVYIANIVKCRPPNNRTPAKDEIAQCLPYLQRQIELLQPKLIVALGKVASNALLRMGVAEGIGHPSASPLRGLGQEATLASLRNAQHDYHGIPLIVTYHPAYLLRSPTEKAKAWQDLCFAVKVMAQVTDKNA